MGPVTLSKQNRLYWLGRYAERVYMTVQLMMKEYDSLLDGTGFAYADFCRRLGAENVYANAEDFCRRYLFDENQPCSAKASMDALLGNGMVLRETISSPTLSYLQMAESAMEMASRSEAPAVELQWVLDDIMAFYGSFDGSVEVENARNITKTGGLVERLSLMLRLDLQPEKVEPELQKLVNRLYKTDLTPQPGPLAVIEKQALEDQPAEPAALLAAVEGLFVL